LVVKTFEDTAKQFNSMFDAETFANWILDVAEKRRDLDGKKIKGAK
jgi:hypothetical protein